MAAVVAVLVLVAGAGAGAQVHSPVLGAATQVRRDYTVHSHNKQVNTGNNVTTITTEQKLVPPRHCHCTVCSHRTLD